jgi:hypothetical protein
MNFKAVEYPSSFLNIINLNIQLKYGFHRTDANNRRSTRMNKSKLSADRMPHNYNLKEGG